MATTAYKGSALVVQWLTAAGGTVALTGDSRVFTITEESNEIDVTTRSDNAKAYLVDYPDITATLASLDTTGTAQAWDQLNIGDTGTIRWYPNGTAASNRLRTLPAIVKTKEFNSPYDNAVEVNLTWRSNGGTVTRSTT